MAVTAPLLPRRQETALLTRRPTHWVPIVAPATASAVATAHAQCINGARAPLTVDEALLTRPLITPKLRFVT